MKASIKYREKTIASERYCPALSEQYQALFQRLTRRLEDTLPMNRARIISEEIQRFSGAVEENDLECKKYMAALSVLIDLSIQGWIFDFQDHQLTLKMENDSIDDKEKIRYRLSAERNAQFKNESVARFIKYMEAERDYNGTPVSVKCLIGNKDALILAIREGHQVCAPYIQMVTGDRDVYTGFKLSDIWRYFRYTWSIPYKTMPGRNIYYLVRDSLQPYHPIIGIFALGNSVLNLTARDDDIGWTVEAIKKEMSQRIHTEYCEQTVSGTDGKTVKVKIQAPIETEDEYLKRRHAYADCLFPLLVKNVNTAISEIYTGDLGYFKQTKYPRQEKVDELYAIAAEYSERSINNRNNEISPDWREEARSNLFKRKRASELAKLLETKTAFNNAIGQSNEDRLLSLLSYEGGRKAIYTALIANRKCKIGSNMMDIIVCGSIPPYNQLLGGKLVSILACSPRVISDYTHRYEKQISEIASRMKGEQVIRDSRLVYLGTTSLYAVGSSQYNRIKVPLNNGRLLEFREMGVTEGYGTVFFSKETTALFSQILELQDGGKRINHVFGEGTSPRFRMISRGLSSIGIRAEAFLKHDDSLNDGMLGKVKGHRSLNFKLTIAHHKYSYSKILDEISHEQHMLIIFDPNEVKIETAQNNRQIHIHPLCVPKVYKYNPIDEKVEIRPASEGGIFTVYASIIEKLNEHPSTFSHTSTSFYTPLKRETYDAFLDKCDWLIILDQSLKSWDISLRAASEKLFYRENDYRSIGIYSSNCRKFVLGYDTLVKSLGNFVPSEEGVKEIIEAVREINDDGLLSIVSHTSNRIFDTNHGKGSLGIALAAIHYKRQRPDAILVGLDTQLAQEWLSDREDGKLPDLIGINFESDTDALVDIIEVKTYSDNPNAFTLDGDTISGHAVEQVTALEGLAQEMLGKTEKITTISRREILREQVFECLFQAELDPASKLCYSNMLNDLFAGGYNVSIRRNIAFVDFENAESFEKVYKGTDDFMGRDYTLITIGSNEVQAILANTAFDYEASLFNPTAQVEDAAEAVPSQEPRETSATESAQEARPVHSLVASDAAPAPAPDVPAAPVTPVALVTELQRTNIRGKCAKINKVFRDYGINAYPVDPDMVQEAARFTRFSVELKSGETIRTLERFKTDIGIQLEANGEILIDHIKGTKYLSVDVPFAGASKSISLLEHLSLLDESSGALDFVAGQKADGRFEIVDIAKAPHMLIAGTTGSGKTIFLYSIIVSLLHKYPMEDLEFLIIDPKQTDFVFFEDLPNLYGGHVVVNAEEALEMIQRINDVDKEERMQQIRSCRSRDIGSYNEKNPDHRMKRIIIIIDEYADLIQTAEMQGKRKEFEKFLSMLAQKVRSLGIHLIIATQRPSANIVTGVLKANIPYRISFRLPSHTDSQTILDMSGAENLLGKGDMLLVTDSDTIRMQGLYISEDELDEFVRSR